LRLRLRSSAARTGIPPCLAIQKSFQETLRIQRGEEAVEGVVAGDAVGQFDKGGVPPIGCIVTLEE